MTSFNMAPFHFYDKEDDGSVQLRNSNMISVGIFFLYAYQADYFFKLNQFCCNGALFLWQLQHIMNMDCLSNTVATATFTRFLHNIIANLIDNICYYALCMN